MTAWDFDWFDSTQIVVPEQSAIAVYTNKACNVEIRQTNWMSDDVWIEISPIHVPRLVAAMLEAANLPADTTTTISGVPK